MTGRQLKEKLARCEYVYGSHVVGVTNAMMPEWYAGCGMDFAFICSEHMPLDRGEISEMCKLFAYNGVSPMVRVPYPDARLATIAVEGGAEGIVIPYVETVDVVRAVSAALRYRPIKGKFLEDILSGKRVPKPELRDYLERLNQNLYLVIGIESVYAIENLEKLIAVEGVSAVFLGPHDITCSMEIPCDYTNPKFIATLVDVVRRCRAAGVSVGLHNDYTLPQYAPLLEAGANFILQASDIYTSTTGLKNAFAYVRDHYENKGK
jgi:4-hydroxy-2-oxoheptanedioate aldolase